MIALQQSLAEIETIINSSSDLNSLLRKSNPAVELLPWFPLQIIQIPN